jgi:ABC-type multidrug transport system ATPase subunit
MSPAKEGSISNLRIRVQSLGKRFNREWIFRNLNYTFEPSNIYAITGPNGSGKSTLLQVLWGQLPQSTGELIYPHASGEIPIDEIFQYLAIATPYLDLIEEFTLLEHLRFHFRLKRSRDGIHLDEILDRLMLAGARDKHIANFSSGMKQRIKLALAFFSEADLIFLDEPTTNLDRETKDWYHAQLEKLPPQCTIFIASNQPDEYPGDAKIINILDFK